MPDQENKSTPGKTTKLILLFFLSTVCFILSWQSENTAFLIFVVFVPVFIVLMDRGYLYNDRLLLYILSFLSVFLSTWFAIYWIRNVNPSTHFVITLLRGLTMLLPYIAAYIFLFSARPGKHAPVIVFITAWMMMEILHDLNILGMSYGNLGHVLAAHPGLIQWYSITGNLGGTLWILLVNYTLYLAVKPLLHNGLRNFSPVKKPDNGVNLNVSTHARENVHSRSSQSKWVANVLLFLLSAGVPIIISGFMYRSPAKTSDTGINVIALHTSMDVFDYKYEVEPGVLLEAYIDNSKKYIDSSTSNIIFWPENAVTGAVYYNNPDSSAAVIKIRKELINRPGVMLVTGAIVDEITDKPDPDHYSPHILYDEENDYYFKRYNAALYITSDSISEIKIKKRLVPLSEKVPPQKIFAPLVSLVPNLEDLNFSPGHDAYTTFTFSPGNIRTSPVICYGSVFSTFTAGEVLHTNSDFLAIILNEGWMKSVKAYRHFNWFAICRAIENKRFLVKSSNEGISTIIDSKGKMKAYISGKTSGAVSGNLMTNSSFSFYTKYHQHIIYGMLFVGVILITFLALKSSPSGNRKRKR